MTVSMLIVTLSFVITGWGGNVITVSRRSTSGFSESRNGIEDVQAGVERAAVAADPFDDAGERLRDDPDVLEEDDDRQEYEYGDDDQRSHGRPFEEGITTPARLPRSACAA